MPWLARDVDRQLANAVVVAFPSVGHADAPFRVRGTIASGTPTPAGIAVLVVQWECVTDKGAVLVPLRTSRYTAQASKAGNYGDIVGALNQTLAEFASEVAVALSSALASSPNVEGTIDRITVVGTLLRATRRNCRPVPAAVGHDWRAECFSV